MAYGVAVVLLVIARCADHAALRPSKKRFVTLTLALAIGLWLLAHGVGILIG